MRFNHAEACRVSMPNFRKRSIVFWSFPFLIFLSGCSAKPECDSSETRLAVLQAVSDDHNNALGKYAAKNPNTAKSSDASSEAEKSKERPLYLLGEKIVTTSTSEDKRTLTCSGSISATVGDTKASKEIEFTVQQSPDGKTSVPVILIGTGSRSPRWVIADLTALLRRLQARRVARNPSMSRRCCHRGRQLGQSAPTSVASAIPKFKLFQRPCLTACPAPRWRAFAASNAIPRMQNPF
jgi:hypothetical protein